MTRWLLICDVSHARIFRKDNAGTPLQLVKEIANPDGRAREQQLVSDEPGRVNKPGGAGIFSAMDPKNTAHDEVVARFARHLAELLDTSALKNEYDELAIVAPAKFLGTLRNELSQNVTRRLKSDMSKDLAHVPVSELPSHLKDLGPEFAGLGTA